MRRFFIILIANILTFDCLIADNYPMYDIPDTLNVCEGSDINLGNMPGLVADPTFTVRFFYNNDMLPEGETHINVASGLNILVIHTFREDENYWDTIFMQAWAAPHFSLSCSDTNICRNNPVELKADSIANCDNFYWENNISHAVYPNGTVLNFMSDSIFTARGISKYCDRPLSTTFSVHVIPIVTPDDIDVWLSQTYIEQCFGPYCTLDLNKLIETNADSIVYLQKKWTLSGTEVSPIVNNLTASSNNYILYIEAVYYENTVCGIVSDTVSKILTLTLAEPDGGCGFKANKMGDQYLSCQPTPYTITHNHANDIQVFTDSVSIVSAQGNDIQSGVYDPETGVFQWIISAFLDDTIYFSLPYYDSCYREYRVFKDTAYFNPKYVPINIYAEYCIGSAIHIYVYAYPDSDDINFLLDSLAFGNDAYHFVLVGHSNSYLHYSSVEAVDDYLDGFTIPAKVVMERCGRLDSIDVIITPYLGTCYPYIAANKCCYGDSTIITVIERRYSNSYIKDIQFNFTSNMPVFRVDTLVFYNGTIDSTRYFRFCIISYETLQTNFVSNILYSDNGNDTTIVRLFSLNTSMCQPVIDFAETCNCYSTPVSIINQNYYGHIVSVDFHADNPIEYQSISTSNAVWTYSLKSSAAQTIYADICYTAGDSTLCCTESFAPINPAHCEAHLSYFDGRACPNDTIMFTFVPNEYFAYNYEYADWNSTTNIIYEGANENYLYFSTIASQDIVFDVTFYFTDCIGDTIKYHFADTIFVAKYVNIFNDKYLAVCQENTINLWDFVNNCIDELYCLNCTGNNTVQIPQGLDSLIIIVQAHTTCSCESMPSWLYDTITVYRDKPGTVVIHEYDNICEGYEIQLKCDQLGVYDYVTWLKNGDTLAAHLPFSQSIISEIVDTDAWYKVICENYCYHTVDSFYLHTIPNPPSEIVSSNVCPDRETTLRLKWNGVSDSTLTCWVYLGDTIFGSKLYIGYADTAVYEYFTYMPNGCIRSMIDTFYTAQLPNIQIITDYADKSDTVLICLQTIESGQLTLYAEGGMYYQWFAPPEFNDDYLTDHITITTIVDNVWLIGTDSNTCSNIAMLHIMTAKDYGTPDWGDSITCKYYPVSFTADTSLWYNTYTWISPSGQIYNNPQVDIERFEIADSGVWTLLTAHAECVDTSYFRLGMKFFENPVILGIEDFYCEHDTIILETENNDGYSFYWRKLGLPAYSGMRDSIISTDSIVVFYDINDNTSGIYNLQVETRGCYFTTLDFEIDVHKIRLNLPDSTFICIGDIIKIGVNNPNFQHYFWNTGDSTAIINIIKGGIYTVKFADQECENSDSIFVNERLKPYFWLGNDTIICEEDEIELYVDMPDADNIVWQDNSHDNPYLVTSRNIYIATVEKNECFASDTIIVQEKFCRPLYFPTAFAPNSAIVENRIFKTIGTISTDLIEYQMVIYDKSGQLVFQTDDPNVGWDGKMNGRDAPASAYVYQVRLLSITDLTERLYTGTIVLIR